MVSELAGLSLPAVLVAIERTRWLGEPLSLAGLIEYSGAQCH